MTFSRWHAQDGWPLRSFSWPQSGTARGSLLFLNGRGDFIEKYLEVLDHWHGQGWNLAGFDWRGQGGSGRMLADPMICHQPSIDPLLTDLSGFVADWIARTPAPHVIVAHSMGGHLTLRMLAEGNKAIDAAILCCPMIDMRVAGMPGWVIGTVARGASLIGRGEKKVWHRDIGDVRGHMTSCPERRDDKAWWKTTHPTIASGPPSWGWVLAAHRSIRKLNDRLLSRITVPVLLLGTERDPVIDVGAIRRVAQVLPKAEITVYDSGGHELLREADTLRLPALARIDDFLRRATAAPRAARTVTGPAAPRARRNRTATIAAARRA